MAVGVEAGTQDPSLLTFIVFDWQKHFESLENPRDFNTWKREKIDLHNKNKNKAEKTRIKN